MQERPKILQNVITNLMITNPFFASILLQQKIVENNNLKTFAVDGENLFYNSEFAKLLNFDQIKGTIVHELNHLILLHHTRQGLRKHDLWNKATDYCINYELIRAGFVLPENIKDENGNIIFEKALIDNRFANKSAEDVYRILEKEEQDKQKSQNNQNNKQNGGQQNNSSPGNSNQNNSSNSQGQGNNQSGNNNPGKIESHEIGEVVKATNAGQEETTKMQIAQAIAISKSHGQSIGEGIERQIKQNKPHNDWREILNRFIQEQFPRDYSWSKPNKRFIHQNIILPSLDGKTTGKFVIVCDTSGSVSESELNATISEVFCCIESLMDEKTNIEIPLIYCDEKVRGVDIIDSLDFKPNVKGGGGTSYREAFEYIKENNDGTFDNTIGILYLTDGYCGYQQIEEPYCPVLWLITTDEGMTYSKKDFGEVVRFDIES